MCGCKVVGNYPIYRTPHYTTTLPSQYLYVYCWSKSTNIVRDSSLRNGRKKCIPLNYKRWKLSWEHWVAHHIYFVMLLMLFIEYWLTLVATRYYLLRQVLSAVLTQAICKWIGTHYCIFYIVPLIFNMFKPMF